MVWLIALLLRDGLIPLASAVSAITVFLAMIFLRRHFTPYRWLGAGIALALLFTVYPLLYTLYLSTTNMGSGHLMSKQQAISRLEEQMYLPDSGQTYGWTAFVSPAGDYALWLQADDGSGVFALPGQPLETVTPGTGGVGELGRRRRPGLD